MPRRPSTDVSGERTRYGTGAIAMTTSAAGSASRSCAACLTVAHWPAATAAFTPTRRTPTGSPPPGDDVDYHTREDWVRQFGIDLDTLSARRRRLIRYCTDWSEQRHHLAGGLGAAIADRLLAQHWIEPAATGRAIHLTDTGRHGLHETLGIEIQQA